MLRRFIIALTALIVLLVVAALAAPMFIPTETVRGELIAHIEQATGRQARIDGPIAISLLPTVHVSAGGIGLAGLTGSGEALKVDSVSFGVGLLPLISGRVAIKSITIVKPELVYEIDAAGHSNWQAAAEPPAEQAAGRQPKSMEDLIASAETPQQALTQETLATLDRIGVDRLTVQDGTLTYRDQRSGSEQTVSAMNLTLSAPDLARGAKLDGSFAWDGKTEKISLTLGARPDPTKLAALPVDFSLSDDLVTITAKGTALDGDTMFTGIVTANGGSLANLAGRFGAALPTAPAYGAFDLSATLAATGERTTLEHFAVDLGGAKFDGQAVIATNRPRPGIGLRLTAGSIDADAFVVPAAAAADGGTGSAPAAETPIDLSALGAVDANVAFAARAVRVGSVALKDLGLDAKLVDGTLQATISRVTVNDAPGSGNLTVSTKGGTPAISGAVKMSGLDLAGVLALAGVSAPVTGSGSVDVAFKTSGATSSALANNLDASGSLSLANGKVTGLNLADAVGGDKAANEIDDIAVTAAFKSLTSPISAKGALTWRKVRFDVSANADVRALLAGKTTAVALQAQSKTVSLGFDGDAGMSGLGKGEVVLSTPSLRNLLAWIGQPMGAGGGLQAFSIKGAVALTKDQFSFDRASFTLDKSSGLGTGTVAFGKRLSVSAGLSMKQLDVTPYLAASGVPTGGGANGGDGAGGARGTGGGGSGWSTAPIAFDGLKAVDANLNLKADQIIANKIKVGATAMTVTLAGGKLAANLTDMNLYDGKGSGALSIDGAAATPAVAASFQLSGLSALPFLTDAIGFDRIEGTGAFSFDLSASGDSQAALMRALKGKGATEFRDGAIRGFNLASLKGLSLQSVLGGQLGSSDSTEFSRLAGSYTIDGGVLTNNDLVLVGPLIRASGAGTVDIGSRTISYRLEPKIVGTLQGQGASGDATGLSLPFRIEGSWDNPRTIPEFGDILANPNQTVDQLKKVGGGLLNSIFGGGDKAGNGGGQAPAAQQPAAAQPAEPAAQQQPEAAPSTAGEPQPITPEANQPQDSTAPAGQPGAAPADRQQPGDPLQLLIPQIQPQTGQ